MAEHHRKENSTLLLAFVIGVATHGTFSAFFNNLIPFSIFPVLTLILSVYCLHQRYLYSAMTEGLPKMVVGFFLFGIFSYATFLRAGNSELGSNFVTATFSVIIALWMYRSWLARKREQKEMQLEAEAETNLRK
nr:YijD family membrane protein [uncultured Moellerella sp.]